MINNILIPTDFSPASWRAMMLGLEIANLNNSQLSLLHVYPIVSKYSKSNKHLELPTTIADVKKKMNDFSENLEERGQCEISNIVLPGNVEETIIKYVAQNDFDMVIVGVNGNGSNNELGSHTAKLIEKSGTPVLVVPNQLSKNGAVATG